MLEASEGAPDAAGQDDVDLASIALPTTAIKRIVRSAAPGVRFSSEAIAGFHRVAQAFVLFATDRCLAEQTKEMEKVRKAAKSKHALPRKTLTSEHVMRFLSAELPPIASKVSTLFPDLMPTEFKPAGVLLLEQLHEQSKAAMGEAPTSEQTSLHFNESAAAQETTTAQAGKRERDGHATDDKETASKPSSSKKAKTSAACQSASLSQFFGASKAAPKAAHLSTSDTQAQETSNTLLEVDEASTFEEDAQPREV
jgi:histone H3/H4